MINPGQTAEAQYEEAISYYKDGQYAHALIAFEQAIGANPRFAPAHNGKGAALYGLACYKQALVAFEQAIQLDSAYAHAWYNRGATLYCLRRYKQALEAFQRTGELDPSFAAAHTAKNDVRAAMKQERFDLFFWRKNAPFLYKSLPDETLG